LTYHVAVGIADLVGLEEVGEFRNPILEKAWPFGGLDALVSKASTFPEEGWGCATD
jgi:hypothetical protein